MRNFTWLVLAAAGACSVAAGCGSSDSTGSKPNAAAPPIVPSGEAGTPLPEASVDAPFAGDDGPTCGWKPYSDGLSGASIVDVLFDTRSHPAIVYASGGSSFYMSGDNGHTWRTAGTFAGGSIGLIATPSNNPEEFLAASSAGVLHSVDGGVSWSVLSLDGQAVSSITAAAGMPLRVYIGVRGSGVLRSDDGGSTWSAVDQGYPYADTLAIDVAPDNPDEVVGVGALLNNQNGYSSNGVIVRTTDGGNSWQTVATGNGTVWNVRRCVADPTVLYAAANSGVVRSSDRGATWTPLPLGMSVVEDVEISHSDCNDIYAMASTEGPHHSTDGGKTFGPVLTQGLDQFVRGTFPGRMAIDPANKGGVVLGSHGGIWYATDGATWNTAQGLLGMQVDGLAVSPTDPSRVWLASWGSGIWQRPSPSQTWQRVSAATLPVDYAFTVAPDPYTAKRVLIGTWSELYQSNDGTTFAMDPVKQNEQAIAFDSKNAGVVYVGTELTGVYKSTDGGSTWTASNNGISQWQEQLGSPVIDVTQLVVDPGSPQTVLAGTNGRGVYRSADGAQSWQSVLAPMQVIQCLVAVPGAATTMYACVKGNGVQVSTDGGNTWSDLSMGLPTQDIGGLVADQASGRIYAPAGSDVFVKTPSQPWAPLDAACKAATGATQPVIVVDGKSRSLVVAASGGVNAHGI